MRRLGILGLLLLLPAASAGEASAATTQPAHSVVLLGDRGKGTKVVQLRSGHARAYPLHARRTGVVHSVSIFLGRHSRARRVTIGIYSNRADRPRTLVRSGSTRVVHRGGWATLHLRATRLHRSRTYWVALLAHGGALTYRSGHRKRCTVATARARAHGALPRSWHITHPRYICPPSVHFTGQVERAKTPKGPPTKPPVKTPPPKKPPTTNPKVPTNCAGHPGSGAPDYATIEACGFPSPRTTGISAGTALTPIASAALPPGASWSGNELDITGNNVTISGVSITDGAVHITGANDTITNSFISSSATTTPTILAYDGAANTVLSHDELEAPDSELGVVNDADQEPLVLEGSYVHNNCTGLLGTNVTATDNYIITDAVVPDCHVEDGYIPGGTTVPTTYEHNTLLNPQGQTAAVFLDNHAYGPNHNVTINDNLMGGGGYVTYGDTGGDGSSNIVITNNRFTRLYYPDGGFYGAEIQNDDATTFSGNIWDDTLKPVRPDH